MSGERGGGNGEQMNSRNLEEVKLTGLSIIDKEEGGMESDSRFWDNCMDGGTSI